MVGAWGPGRSLDAVEPAMVFACREGVVVSRIKAIDELRALIVVAPDQLRVQLHGCSLTVQLR